MLDFKGEVQNKCEKCNYVGYDFKLYQDYVEVDDDVFEYVGNEIVICPKCNHEELV